MRWMAFAVVSLVASGASPARADTIPIIDNLPNTYTPGQSFTFQLSLPALTDFTSYSLQLVFTTDVTDPPLTASGAAATANYPFPSTANFQSSLNSPSGFSQVILTISDSTSSGVTVTPGTNDALATITVNPGAALTDSISLSIGSDSVFSYNTETGTDSFPTDIPSIDQSTTTGTGTGPSPSPVPAPTGAVLLGIGGLLLGAHRARGR